MNSGISFLCPFKEGSRVECDTVNVDVGMPAILGKTVYGPVVCGMDLVEYQYYIVVSAERLGCRFRKDFVVHRRVKSPEGYI